MLVPVCISFWLLIFSSIPIKILVFLLQKCIHRLLKLEYYYSLGDPIWKPWLNRIIVLILTSSKIWSSRRLYWRVRRNSWKNYIKTLEIRYKPTNKINPKFSLLEVWITRLRLCGSSSIFSWIVKFKIGLIWKAIR